MFFPLIKYHIQSQACWKGGLGEAGGGGGGGGGGVRPPDFGPALTARPPRFSDLATCMNLLYLTLHLSTTVWCVWVIYVRFVD